MRIHSLSILLILSLPASLTAGENDTATEWARIRKQIRHWHSSIHSLRVTQRLLRPETTDALESAWVWSADGRERCQTGYPGKKHLSLHTYDGRYSSSVASFADNLQIQPLVVNRHDKQHDKYRRSTNSKFFGFYWVDGPLRQSLPDVLDRGSLQTLEKKQNETGRVIGWEVLLLHQPTPDSRTYRIQLTLDPQHDYLPSHALIVDTTAWEWINKKPINISRIPSNVPENIPQMSFMPAEWRVDRFDRTEDPLTGSRWYPAEITNLSFGSNTAISCTLCEFNRPVRDSDFTIPLNPGCKVILHSSPRLVKYIVGDRGELKPEDQPQIRITQPDVATTATLPDQTPGRPLISGKPPDPSPAIWLKWSFFILLGTVIATTCRRVLNRNSSTG